MLNSLNLNDKTYEELLAEAIAQIPLYSREWTNYNVSDPGITMLQNLTAFQQLQQEEINSVPQEIWRKLLKLVGYSAREEQAATVLVQAPPAGGPILPVGHQMWSGNIPFETTELVQLNPWGLAAVYAVDGERYRDLTQLLDPATDGVAYPFGTEPTANRSVICVLRGIPEQGEPLRLWVQIAEEELRTPFVSQSEIPEFSRICWQYYTEEGWQDVRVQDETMGLLRSGQVTLWLESGTPEVCYEAPTAGCALRCLLTRADYDRVPRVKGFSCHLFPMEQRETRVHSMFAPAEDVLLQGTLAQQEIFQVFCKETPEGPYIKYRPDPENGLFGRFYREERTPLGLALRFDQGPCAADDAVCVVCYDQEMVNHRLLGPVYSYDAQTIQLEQVENLLPDSCLVALMMPSAEVGVVYRFVKPGEVGPEGFRYHLRPHEAQIVVDDPGRGGCQLLLAGCAVTQGVRGNLRAGAVLEQRGGYDGTDVEAVYPCPTPGRNGVDEESMEELRIRFSAGMRATTVAVRTDDYETLVRQVPGLCIHKVKAVAVPERNLVEIAVKPYGEEELPGLSPTYLHQIQEYLEPRRMLTTRFRLCQPRYVPICVQATLSVRGVLAQAEQEAEQVLRKALDYVNGPQNFGSTVRFNELYQKLKALPFVEGIDALYMYPETKDAVLIGSDIRLGEDSLCYAGTIRLSFRERGR